MARKKKYMVTIGEDEYKDLKEPDVQHLIIVRAEHEQKVTIVKDNDKRIAEYPGHIEFKIQIME